MRDSEFMTWENFWCVLGSLIVLFLTIVLGCLLTKAIFADNKVKYCIIEAAEINSTDEKGACYRDPQGRCLTVGGFKVTGHVDWRQDQVLGYYKTFGEATDITTKSGCALSTK